MGAAAQRGTSACNSRLVIWLKDRKDLSSLMLFWANMLISGRILRITAAFGLEDRQERA